MTLLQKEILKTLRFYTKINRPLSILEIYRAVSNNNIFIIDIVTALDELRNIHGVVEHNGFFAIISEKDEEANSCEDIVIQRKYQDVLMDIKWKKFLSLIKYFKYIPFVNIVCASGSMALGNAEINSDFDVVIGAKKRRIFTTRLFCILFFSLLRKRRKKITHHDEAKNQICLNHFVTKSGYKLSPPYNIYWTQLYRNLVPLYGTEDYIKNFFNANDWSGTIYYSDRRNIYKKSVIKKIIEKILDGKIGDFVECMLKDVQQKRIAKGLSSSENTGYRPRIKYDDSELEFHPDTRRIEEMII